MIGICGGAAVLVFGKSLLGLFSASEAVVAAGRVMLKYLCIPYFICGLLDSTIGCLRGMGSSFIPMLITSFGICGLRVLWIYTVCRLPQYKDSIDAIYISYPIAWCVTYVAQFAFFVYSIKRLKARADDK